MFYYFYCNAYSGKYRLVYVTPEYLGYSKNILKDIDKTVGEVFKYHN